MKKITIILSVLIAMTIKTNAQTNVSGLISSNTVWTLANSPYIVTGNLLVNNGVTLTIDPGVTVKFNSGLSMQIDGTLIAQGTSSDSITFTSNTVNTAGAWGYIYFSDASTDAVFQNNIYGTYLSGSMMQYCTIQYAGGVTVSNNGALRMEVAYPFIDHCSIIHNLGAGINAFDGTAAPDGDLKITNSWISDNFAQSEGGGIYASGADVLLVSGNRIDYNSNPSSAGSGVFASYCDSYVIIEENIISHNNAFRGGGINAGDSPHILINNNIITSNSSTGGGGSAISVGGGTLEITENLALYNTNEGGGTISINSGGTVSNNIVADNISSGTGGGMYMPADASLTNNHIIRNTAVDIAGLFEGNGSSPTQKNTIVDNLSTDLSSTNKIIYLSNNALPQFHYNNIFRNTASYELSNGNDQGTSSNVTATENWWGTTDDATIQGKIYDWFDDNSLSLVNYSPYLLEADTGAPVSIPFNVTKTDMGGGNVEVKWNQNPETDVAGYHVYYGNFTGYSFTNMIDVVGKADTSCTLTGVPVGDTIAVTAYDSAYNPANENVSTITNDNMTNGNESWFAYAVGKPSPAFSATPVSVCPGDTVYYTANTGNVYSYANTAWSWLFPGGVPSSSNLKNPKVVYNTPGNYDATLKVTNIAGSDSLTQVNYITINSPTYATVTEHLCNVGYYTSPSGNYTWYSSGTYHDTIPNYSGCDSMLTFHLTFNYDSYNSINPESCDSYTSPSGNYIWTSSGLYYDTIPNTGGCDSILTIYLTVTSIDTSITQAGSVLTVNTTGASYQWLDCGNGYSTITGETNQSFTPIVYGDYAVQITQNNCTDTSSCYNFIVESINDLNNDNIFEIFPNPASDHVVLKLNNLSNENLQLNIYNIIGVMVRSEVLKQKQQKTNIGDLSDGIYMVEIKSKEWSGKQKLIIQR